MGSEINFCQQNPVKVGEELAEYTGAADNEAALVLRRERERLGGGVGHLGPVNGDVLPGDDDVVPPAERTAAGEILHRFAPHDHRRAGGVFAEMRPVGVQHDGLRPACADAPVGIYRYDRVHSLSSRLTPPPGSSR